MPATYNFPKQVQGETFTGAVFTLLADGQPLDLTGANISFDFHFFDFTGVVSKALEETSGITVNDAAAGQFTINSFLNDMPIGRNVYRCLITTGGITKTFFTGVMRVMPYTSFTKLSASMTPDEITVNVSETPVSATAPISVDAPGSVTIPAGSLIKDFFIEASGTGDVLIGTTEGGAEIATAPMSIGETQLVLIPFYSTTETIIYFTGAANVKFKIETYA